MRFMLSDAQPTRAGNVRLYHGSVGGENGKGDWQDRWR
jgi:hypothetical protein